jgi:hypothetical protein
MNNPKNLKKCDTDGYLYDIIPRTFNPNEKLMLINMFLN